MKKKNLIECPSYWGRRYLADEAMKSAFYWANDEYRFNREYENMGILESVSPEVLEVILRTAQEVEQAIEKVCPAVEDAREGYLYPYGHLCKADGPSCALSKEIDGRHLYKIKYRIYEEKESNL